MGIFKAYDIRGLVPQELDAELARKIGHAFARFLRAERLVVGQDMRTHSPELADAVAEGMRDAGASVIRLGLASTPMTYFAIATLPFAYTAQKTFFQDYLGVQGGFGGTDSKSITRPVGFSSSEEFYYLLMGSLLLMALICSLVNRSWIGTSLTALRHSEAALSVLGHSPGAYKLFTICLSGAIATVGGAYFGMLQGLVPSNYFQPALAILYFGFAVAGGLGSVSGAVVAGTAFGAIPKYFDSLSEGKLVGYDLFFIGFLSLGLVLWAPGGLADIGRRVWRRLEGQAPAPRAVIGFEEIDIREARAVAPDEGLAKVDAP